MLPFSSFPFIYFIVASISFLAINRFILKYLISFRISILLISIGFLVFYPQPVHILVFSLYSYGVLHLSVGYFKSNQKLLMTLLALLPMLLMKLDIKTEWFQIVGLSYISFRTVQIIVDTNNKESQISILDFLSFVLFTPTLLIGPIDRSDRFLKNINDETSFNGYRFLEGLQFILKGLVFKFVLAVLINDFWMSFIVIENWVDHVHMAYVYTAYLFFDFAGYSALAVGYGKLLGIDVPINFDKPYLAVNPPDFWRRWHKSLGDWLRDYFFKPIYKELSSRDVLNSMLQRQNLALFLTFFLMGCWNGFKLYYILSGALFGFYSMVYNTYLYNCKKKKKDIIFKNLNPFVVKGVSIFIMLNLACLAIYVFSGKIV